MNKHNFYELLSSKTELWEHLALTKKPIVIYGMGNGAEKILSVLAEKGIKAAAFMASDEFIRGQSFCGYKVHKLSEIEEMYEDFIILIAFGTFLKDVLERIYKLTEIREVYAPDVPVYGDGLFDRKYIERNREKILAVHDLLSDEFSKKVFENILYYRLTGNFIYLKEITSEKKEAERFYINETKGFFYDLGAYNGDTVDELILAHHGFRKIISVEPDRKNIAKLQKKHISYIPDKLIPINAAVYRECTELIFSASGGRHSALHGNKKTVKIPAVSVDKIAERLGKPSVIKYDVEGSENDAILGSAKTIREYLPTLIVSVYHRTDDILDLPLLVSDIIGKDSYDFYLRHFEYIPAWDTNLYCKKRDDK